MNRAYSVLTVKSLSDDDRVIRGIATTPQPDREGDIVDPLGVTCAAVMPLLWQHQHDKPVGTVSFDKATAAGIAFEARLPHIAEPGPLKYRVDEAWQSVKAGLVTAVSIGFRPLKDGVEMLKEGGLKFLKTEVFELSLVTIPANANAVITAIKSIDQQHLSPASGPAADQATAPGVSGHTKAAPVGPVSLISRRKDALK